MYSPNARQLEIDNFIGGLNVTKPPTDINDNQSPDCLNIINNELAGINSRYGYTKYYSTAIGTLAVNGLFVYNTYSSSDFLLAYGTQLRLDLTSNSTALWSGLTSGTVRSFEIEGNIYFVDGTNYIYYNGSAATAVVGYIPTYKTGKEPDGSGGDVLDELNFIQSGFIEKFNGNGTATTFYMTYGSLTTSNNIVIVNNTTLTSGAATAGFNVNYASGYFTLTTAPTTGVNNVEIQAYKPVLDENQIKNCTFCEVYGEGNDTNVFLSGNSSYPARIFWSDTLDPTYFPSTSYADVGVKNDKMMGFLNLEGSLLLKKYRSIHAFNGTPPNNSIILLYDGEGCIATDTIKEVEGYATFLSQRGAVQLKRGSDGYRLDLISEDINGLTGIRDGLQTETLSNRQNAFAYVFDNKYWLHVDTDLYIYQYNLKHSSNNKTVYPWLKWTTANNQKCFIDKEGYLYFGETGNFYKFDPSSTSDDGTAISSYWYSKKIEADKAHDWIKWFLYLYFNLYTRFGADLNVTITLYVDDSVISLPISSTTIEFWNPNDFNPNEFIPSPTDQNIEIRIPIHRKGRFVQFKISCNTLNNMFALVSTKLDYSLDRKAR